MPCVWFIIAILFFAPKARALESPGPMNLAEPETLNWALFDDPYGLHAWVKSSWRALAEKQDSIERVRAFAFYAQLVLQWSLSWDEKEDLNRTADEYLKLSLDKGWTEEYLHLYTLFRHPSVTRENASSEDITRYYQDTLQKIQSMGGSRHRYQNVLDSVLKAQKNYDPKNLFDQRYVEQIKAEALKGLKRFDEAFDALKLAHEIDTKLTKEQSHAEVSSQLADLGLKVEQAKSEALSRENDQKETELKAARRFKIILIALLVLAVLVIGLMIFSLHEKKLLAISQKRIRAILDHIDEAIVLIKPDLAIEAEYSRYLESLFASASEPLKGAHAIRDIIRPFMSNTDDAIVIQNSLEACFHEDRTVWDLNEGHMLQESQSVINGQLRFFSFHWQPIFDSESRLIRVLLGIRDVTARKRMEADFAAARQEKSRLFEKVQELLSVD